VRHLVALRSRRALEPWLAIAAIAFLGWLAMKFYMDNSNDSETEGYVASLLAGFTSGKLPQDATRHYTALAPFVVWPFTAALAPHTRVFLIRGFVLARLVIGMAMLAAAYVWYRCMGLAWLTSLVGLVVLSTSVSFALLIRGWELDKLIEPTLFLIVATLAWRGHWLAVLPFAVLAVANRETGVFVPLVILAALIYRQGSVRSAARHWVLWAAVLVCATEVIWLHRSDGAPFMPWLDPNLMPWLDLNLERVLYVIGGLCLTPLLATAWFRSAPAPVARLFVVFVPIWMIYALGTDRLEQGAVLLTPLALLFVPVTLAGLERVLRPRPTAMALPTAAEARVPVAPAG
jgi:hypothetical protein